MAGKPTQSVLRGWVVLATDTGVGKTHVSATLAQLLYQRGLRPRVRKPIETGCPEHNGELQPADAIRLQEAAGMTEPLATICPLRLRTPVAAPEAARLESVPLDFNRDLTPILTPARANDAPTDAPWLIESAGGLLSPLTDTTLNVELARFTGLPVLLVTPDRLGTLSSTLAAVEVLSHRGITIDAIVLNRRPEDVCTDQPDNLGSLRHWLPRLLPNRPCPRLLVFDNRPDQLLALIEPG